MELASIYNLDTNNRTPSDEQPDATRYIPPARRGSSICTSSGQSLFQHKSSQTIQSPNTVKQKMERRTGILSSNTSSTPNRTPSPKGVIPPILKDSENGQPVEVWQGKRRGGNRAPKIEPEGTKSWRQNNQAQGRRDLFNSSRNDPLNGQSRDITSQERASRFIQPTILKRGYTKTHQMPLARWREYPSELLDTIDMHLNILIQCLSPGCDADLSVRIFPAPLRSALSTGVSVEMLQTSHSPLLPPWIGMEVLFKLASSILDFLNISLSELGYLLRCEEEVGRSLRREETKDIQEMLYSLAIAQVNWDCAQDICQTVLSSFDLSTNNLQRSQVLQQREAILLYMKAKVHDYICETRSAGIKFYDDDVKQLEQDYHNERIVAGDVNIWFRCLACHWCGLVQEIPDYLGMLRMTGCEPGRNMLNQVRNPMEMSWVYALVEVWLNPYMDFNKVMEANAQWARAQNQLDLSMGDTPEPMELCKYRIKGIDFAGNLSLSRDWRNQWIR